MEGLHTGLAILTDGAILLFEYTGVGVIIVSGVLGIIGCIRRNPLTRLRLAKGMALGLELGAFPESACAFVEVRREKSAWRVERALEAMAQKRCLEACRYCLRGTTAFVPVPPEA